VQQSPLDLLKQKLGRDAQLLDEISAHAVYLVVPEGSGIEGYAGEAIKIGSIVDGGAKWTLQAFITTINRKSSGLPEVKVFGFHPEFSQYKPLSVADVLNKAELRDEFKVLKTYDVHALAVVIKVSIFVSTLRTMVLRYLLYYSPISSTATLSRDRAAKQVSVHLR
jgi:hypothetical protein